MTPLISAATLLGVVTTHLRLSDQVSQSEFVNLAVSCCRVGKGFEHTLPIPYPPESTSISQSQKFTREIAPGLSSGPAVRFPGEQGLEGGCRVKSTDQPY